MKRLLFSIFFAGISLATFAQEPEQVVTIKEHKNMLSFDANALLSQFFNWGPYGYGNIYYSPYVISYRRFFDEKNALRVGIGGNVNNSKGKSNDTLNSETVASSFNFGLGWEHYTQIGKKFSIYYGFDFLYKHAISKYSYEYNAPVTRKQTTIQNNYGVAPVFGVVFNISPRISVATEASYNVLFNSNTFKNVYTPSNIYQDQTYTGTGLNTYFTAPTAISFRFRF